MTNYLASTEDILNPQLCSNTEVYESFSNNEDGSTKEAIDKTFGTADRKNDLNNLQQLNNKLNQAIQDYNKVNKQVVTQFEHRDKIIKEFVN